MLKKSLRQLFSFLLSCYSLNEDFKLKLHTALPFIHNTGIILIL